MLSLIPPCRFLWSSLGLGRISNGTSDLVKAVYEIDPACLFEREDEEEEMDQDEDGDLATQAQARKPLALVTHLSKTCWLTRFCSNQTGPTPTAAASTLDQTPPFPTGGVGATHPESEYVGVASQPVASGSGSGSLGLRTQASQNREEPVEEELAAVTQQAPKRVRIVPSCTLTRDHRSRRLCFVRTLVDAPSENEESRRHVWKFAERR